MLGVVIFLAIFIGVWLLNAHVQPENAVEAYKKELLAKGEKLEIGEMIPASVPEAENGAIIVTRAAKSMGTGKVPMPTFMKEIVPGKGMPGWLQPMVSNLSSTNTWENVRSLVAANRPVTQLLQQILKQPRFDFHLDYTNLLDYSNSWRTSHAHFADIVKCRELLCVTVESDLYAGDIDIATTNLCVLLALAHGEESERLRESQLYKGLTLHFATGLTWDYLQSSNVTGPELEVLQKSWEQQQFFEPLEKAYAMDRIEMSRKIERMRHSPAEFYGFLDFHYDLAHFSARSPGEKLRFRVEETMWRDSWSFYEQLRLLRRSQIMLETLRSMETNEYCRLEYDAMTNRLSAPDLANDGDALYRTLNIDDFSSLFEMNTEPRPVLVAIFNETKKRMVVTAIALKKFQLANGHLPAGLSELVPQFIASVPADTMDGKPLRYRPNLDGTFLLYSVGDNGVDDGGNPTNLDSGIKTSSIYWANPKARDWVWPQPASVAEVEKYYAEEAAKSSK